MVAPLGLTSDELNVEIESRMNQLDAAQDDLENLGQFGEILRTATLIAFHRAAELILLNNERITQQLADRD